MLTKRETELIRSLQVAKHREREGLFVAEGLRLVGDMLGAFACPLLVTTQEQYTTLKKRIHTIPTALQPQRIELVEASYPFGKISSQSTPQSVLALFALPSHSLPQAQTLSGISLMLDRVQDPGNMGTILRTADWFGIQDVLLVSGSADPYAPKVVQSSMGAHARLRLHRLSDDGSKLLEGYTSPILGTFLDGENIYRANLSKLAPQKAILIMGNEGNGISQALEPYVSRRITIPHFAPQGSSTESLNVAIATAICLSELKRSH